MLSGDPPPRLGAIRSLAAAIGGCLALAVRGPGSLTRAHLDISPRTGNESLRDSGVQVGSRGASPMFHVERGSLIPQSFFWTVTSGKVCRALHQFMGAWRCSTWNISCDKGQSCIETRKLLSTVILDPRWRPLGSSLVLISRKGRDGCSKEGTWTTAWSRPRKPHWDSGVGGPPCFRTFGILWAESHRHPHCANNASWIW